MSTILDPIFLIPKIRCQICNQWPQKPLSTKFHENRWVSKILCPPYWVRHFQFRKSDVKFVISDLKNREVQTYAKIVEFPKFHVHYVGSAILIPKIQCQIRKQRPQKPWSTTFHENLWLSKILCPPYWVRHFEFRKSDVKFVISDPKNPRVQSYANIVEFPKFHVHHIGSAILNSKNPMSNS